MPKSALSHGAAQLVGRAWRFATRRGNALRFFPTPSGQIAALLRQAGFLCHDAGECADGPSRHADILVWKAALVGTPPHGNVNLDLNGFERLAEARSWDRRPIASLLSSLINAHIATHRSCLGDPCFWSSALEAIRRVGVPYIVIGDSHSLCSCIVGGSMRNPTIPIHVLCTAGSAAGLDNPASRSGYCLELSRMAAALRACDGGRKLPILFQFGQVDVEFVSVFQRIARTELVFDRRRFEVFCEKVVDAYTKFLTTTFADAGVLYVLSIFPPALVDEAWAQGYTNPHVAQLESDQGAEEVATRIRSMAIPTLVERTALHRHFNERLEATCRARHLTFVDLFDRFIGSNGLIESRFIRWSGGLDHHLSTKAARRTARPIIDRIAGRARTRSSTAADNRR